MVLGTQKQLDMTMTHPLALENILYLEQGLALLEALDEELYRRTVPPTYTGSIGAHWRHCLDHYASLLDGLEAGAVDYSARERETRLETDPTYAAERTRDTIRRLRGIEPHLGHEPLRIRVDCGAGQSGTPEASTSTVDRELQFLVSHSVHHYALIALIAKIEGHMPDESFGVAPSTLQYREQQRSDAEARQRCAR